MTRAEVDLAFEDETLGEALGRLVRDITASELLVAVRLVQEHGPGGGWPVVELVGPARHVTNALVLLWDMDLASAVDQLDLDWPA